MSGRLAKRLQHYQLGSYAEYFRLLASGEVATETQLAIDLLTTNETYFFREQKHFDVLRRHAAASRSGESFRAWSAACSTGEEAYSIAMVLADCLGTRAWDVVGSDISSRVLDKARIGHYSTERTQNIPQEYLRRFCLRGIGQQEGTLLVDRGLRTRVSFLQVNLNATLPRLGMFDVIFLRNVLIYFSMETKQEVAARVLSLLKSGGYFCVGHSESLNGITDAVKALAPSIYRKG